MDARAFVLDGCTRTGMRQVPAASFEATRNEATHAATFTGKSRGRPLSFRASAGVLCATHHRIYVATAARTMRNSTTSAIGETKPNADKTFANNAIFFHPRLILVIK